MLRARWRPPGLNAGFLIRDGARTAVATRLPFERDTIRAAMEAAGYEVREVVTRFDVGNAAATSPRISARLRDIS